VAPRVGTVQPDSSTFLPPVAVDARTAGQLAEIAFHGSAPRSRGSSAARSQGMPRATCSTSGPSRRITTQARGATDIGLLRNTSTVTMPASAS
jgi:hypothetical protein